MSDNKREEAIEQAMEAQMETRIDPKDGDLFNAGVRRGYQFGFRDGAASLDRVQVVREIREAIAKCEISVSVNGSTFDVYVSEKVDAALAALEEEGE